MKTSDFEPVERAAEEIVVARLERREHAILFARGQAREPDSEAGAERSQMLDEGERAEQIAPEPLWEARDVAIDEAGDVGVVGRRDRGVFAIGSSDPPGDALDDDVLPRRQGLEPRGDLRGDGVAPRPHDRDRPRREQDRAAREGDEAAPGGIQ